MKKLNAECRKKIAYTNYEMGIFLHNFKYIRKINNLSLKEMSEILQISIYNIKQIEKGILPPRLNVEVVFKIEKCFNISPKKLFCEKLL